ncbi:23S rRNA (pseudouridine(1915)-N(3))-methyltransferase RlmH [Desulfonatronum thiodismutans]|uniref:23S rRNA (pseudouridine(1915)-N(3))-methyltransferase RlmH n=1 Tax=Desulfonatronum thiodismutans TaxID=159290 RepID=UPI0004ABDBBA|nr:23S rRNA (pseudouridine(1915)-N(3))-methyltransferase RlmH [Desulfonatronum thiodismutans]
MKAIACLAVGRLKTPHWVRAAEHYATLIGRFVRFERVEVKDAPGHLSLERRVDMEGKALLAKLGPKDRVLGLDAGGRGYSSEAFAATLGTWWEDPVRRPCFVLGGAFGFSGEIRERCDQLISLSPMTLPHELARVVLLEQVYRALNIQRGTGYHH